MKISYQIDFLNIYLSALYWSNCDIHNTSKNLLRWEIL